MRSWWASLQASERRTLSLAAIALALVLSYLLLVKPLVQARAALRTQVSEQAIALVQVRTQMLARKTTRAAAPVLSSSAPSLLALADQALRAAKLEVGLKSINASGEGRVRMVLEGVNFDLLIATLEQLENTHQVQVVELSADAIAPNMVNVRLSISR